MGKGGSLRGVNPPSTLSSSAELLIRGFRSRSGGLDAVLGHNVPHLGRGVGKGKGGVRQADLERLTGEKRMTLSQMKLSAPNSRRQRERGLLSDGHGGSPVGAVRRER
jgi:hypothetical protein